jgi:hypothetical protein
VAAQETATIFRDKNRRFLGAISVNRGRPTDRNGRHTCHCWRRCPGGDGALRRLLQSPYLQLARSDTRLQRRQPRLEATAPALRRLSLCAGPFAAVKPARGRCALNIS